MKSDICTRALLSVLLVMLAFINVQAETVNNSFTGTELLKNGQCDGTFDHWEKTDAGSGWAVQTFDDGTHAWASSFKTCTLTQTVVLSDAGISDADIDAGKVTCQGAADMKAEWEEYGKGSNVCDVTVDMLDADGNTLSTVTVLNDLNIFKEWTSFRSEVFTLTQGVRKLRYVVRGCDVVYWKGQFGPQFRNLSLKAHVEGQSSIEEPEAICPDGNHPHMIDLGLPSGMRWSCCNVDAKKPEDYGGYYSWGETEEKAEYSWATYKWHGETDGTFQNIGEDIAGTEYDVARVKWGDKWSLPNSSQYNELLNNCTYEWVTRAGVKGVLLTGTNGAKLFIPASGENITYKDLPYISGLSRVGEYAIFYSSNLYASSPTLFYLKEDKWDSQNGGYVVGLPVRPITLPDGIAIDQTNFPDDNFRNMLLKSKYGKDGILTTNEIAGIKALYIDSDEIKDFKGLEIFTAIEYLQITQCNLTDLQLPSLPNLQSLSCEFNQLTSLDVSKFPNIKTVGCSNNKISGAAMDALIQSLPVRDSSDEGSLLVYSEIGNDENVITQEQIEAANTRGWAASFFSSSSWSWVNYNSAAPVTFYPVWIGGTQVTSENMNDVLGDGNVSYTVVKDGGRLTVKTPTLNVTGTNSGSAMIYAKDADLTIIADNGLTLSKDYPHGLCLRNGSLTVEGDISGSAGDTGIYVNDGSLNVYGNVDFSDGSIDKGITVDDNLFIAGNVEMNCKGQCIGAKSTTVKGNVSMSCDQLYTSAIYAWGDLTIEGNVTGLAKQGVIYCNGNITVTGNVDLTSTEDGSFNALYASRDLTVKGNVTVKTEKGALNAICADNITIDGDVKVSGAKRAIYASYITMLSGRWELDATEELFNGGFTIPDNYTVLEPVGGKINGSEIVDAQGITVLHAVIGEKASLVPHTVTVQGGKTYNKAPNLEKVGTSVSEFKAGDEVYVLPLEDADGRYVKEWKSSVDGIKMTADRTLPGAVTFTMPDEDVTLTPVYVAQKEMEKMDLRDGKSVIITEEKLPALMGLAAYHYNYGRIIIGDLTLDLDGDGTADVSFKELPHDELEMTALSGTNLSGYFTDYGKNVSPTYFRILFSDPVVTFDEEESEIAVLNTLAIWHGYKVLANMKRTLKPGVWNTFASPVGFSDFEAVFGAGAKVKELKGTTLSGGELVMSFEEATAIEGYAPYLVKVANEVDLSQKQVAGVVVGQWVDRETPDVKFIPTMGSDPHGMYAFAPEAFVLLDDEGKPYYPGQAAYDMLGMRAYFVLKNPEAVNSIRIDIDDEQTGIDNVNFNGNGNGNDNGNVNGNDSSLFTLHSSLPSWYTLDGRRLLQKPTAKGIYILRSAGDKGKGKTIVIK